MNRSFLFWLVGILLIQLPAGAQVVHTSGAARNVMMGADLSSTVKLDTLLKTSHLFAVGPVHDLQGEITIFDGFPYTSKTESGEIFTKTDSALCAPFLAYSYVNEWISLDVDVKFTGLEDIATLVDSLARLQGINTELAFPFRLHATWDQADFHIIMRDTLEENHSHEQHDLAKQRFTDQELQGDLVGFYSRHHEGVFTHRGQFIHVHYLRDDRTATGHLDGILRIGTVTIFLPVQ